MKKALLLLLIFLRTFSVNAQWKEINQDSNIWIFTDLHFFSKDTGVVVGLKPIPDHNGNGVFFKTTDGGNTWFSCNSMEYASSVESVFFNDDSSGYSFGSGCRVKRTQDQGLNWLNHGPNFGARDGADFILISDSVGLFITTDGQLARSVDTLKTWSWSQDTNVQYDDHIWHNKTNTFHFINDSVGYLLGNGIFETVDAGKSWSPLPVPRIFYNDLFMFNPSHWVVVGNDGVFIESYDAGQNWIYYTISNHHLRDITFFNDSVGIIIGGGNCNHPSDTGVVLTTFNGGISWQEQIISSRGLSAIQCIDSVCYIVGGNQIFKLSNYDVLNIENISPSITKLKTWPNPTSGIVNIEGANLHKGELKVFDAKGNLLQLQSNFNDNSFSLGQYPNGTYFIQWSWESEIRVATVIKQ